jgi:CHAD domain-containing protein
MLKAGKQEKYFRKRYQSLLSHLHAFYAFSDTEELHRVRVEIKKMKALFSLDEKKEKSKKFKTQFKPIKKVFSQAGKIRAAQVNLELLDRYGIVNGEIEKEQTGILIDQSEKFFPKIKFYEKKLRKQFSFFSGKFYSIETPVLKKIFEKELNKLEKSFAIQVSGDKLHECRKQLKRLTYANAVFGKKLVKKIKLKTSYVKKLEETIGKWHDTETAIELIAKTATGKKEMRKLHVIRKKQLKEIRSMTKGFKGKVRVLS